MPVTAFHYAYNASGAAKPRKAHFTADPTFRYSQRPVISQPIAFKLYSVSLPLPCLLQLVPPSLAVGASHVSTQTSNYNEIKLTVKASLSTFYLFRDSISGVKDSKNTPLLAKQLPLSDLPKN